MMSTFATCSDLEIRDNLSESVNEVSCQNTVAVVYPLIPQASLTPFLSHPDTSDMAVAPASSMHAEKNHDEAGIALLPPQGHIPSRSHQRFSGSGIANEFAHPIAPSGGEGKLTAIQAVIPDSNVGVRDMCEPTVTSSVQIAPQCATKESGIVVLESNDLVCPTMDPFIEEEIRYVPGGYHPILLGAILGGSPQRQYRIMHKLGWGSFSTVWLAQRTDQPDTFVSLKITTADNTTQTQEVQMLQKLGRSRSHFVELLDHFMLHGPNGAHAVIVTDVVVPSLNVLSGQPLAWRRAFAYGLVQAVAQLHADRIVHGDLHLGNTGIAMPQLADQDCEAVMVELSDFELTAVLTLYPEKQTASLPAYLVSSCGLGAYYKKLAGTDPPQVKLLDFGTAHEIGTPPPTFPYAVASCAPEIVFARIFENIDNPSVDAPADVWALGTIIYEIVTDQMLFDAAFSDLPIMMARIGRIPSHWKGWADGLYPQKPSDFDGWWQSRLKALHMRCESDEDAGALLRLLRRMLVLDPAERSTAAEILSDPWFLTIHAAHGVHSPPLTDEND